MEQLTNNQLAETIRTALAEAESRAANKPRVLRALKIAHRALHSAGLEAYGDAEVSLESIGGDKEP